jgi:hypothetical protein
MLHLKIQCINCSLRLKELIDHRQSPLLTESDVEIR